MNTKESEEEKKALQERVIALEKELAEAKSNGSMWYKNSTDLENKLEALGNAIKGISGLV